MKPATIVGAVLIVLGAAALVYKGFSYTSEETVLQVGSVKATAQTEKDVAIPSWAGIAAIVVGVLIIGVGRRRKAKKGPTHRVGPVQARNAASIRLAGNTALVSEYWPCNPRTGDRLSMDWRKAVI